MLYYTNVYDTIFEQTRELFLIGKFQIMIITAPSREAYDYELGIHVFTLFCTNTWPEISMLFPD